MKKTLLLSIASLVSTLAIAAPTEDTTALQAYPKNLARQHLGSNLLQYNATTKMFAPTQAAAAWLDDDVTTGWPLMAEKQYYLLTLSRPELLTNFALSTREASGTVSIYASDTAAAPGAESWTPLLKDAPLESVNQKMSRAFSRVAKYILIETNVAEPGPVYSVYLYSHKPAVAYEVQKRERAIEPRSIFGPYVNEGTSFNVASLYAHSTVTQSSGATDTVGWQRAIDDNPETSITMTPGNQPTVIRYNQPRTVSRVALLTETGAKGKVDLYLSADAAATPAAAAPTMTIVLDGTTPRASVDFPATQAAEMRMRWTPTNGTDALTVREVNAFGDTSLSTYAVEATPGTPAAIADQQYADNSSTQQRRGADGKDMVDYKDPKDSKADPIGESPFSGPYLPGALGFPPNVNARLPRNIPVSE